MTDYDLGKVVGEAGEKGDDGSSVWNTSTAPSYANSKYTFNISNLSGKTGLTIAVNDIIFYSTYYYIVSAVNSTTVDCTTRVSIKGSDASVTVVDNLNSDSSTSVLSAKQGKVLNTNKIETSAIATSFGSTTSDSKVPSEKLVSDSLATKQATLISGTSIKTINNTSLLGSGNIDIQGSSVDIVTSWEQTLSDSKVPSEKLTKNSLDDKISKSSTSGLVKNDGTIDTNSYLTTSSLSNYVQKSSTSGLIKNDGSIDTNSYSTTSHSHNQITSDGKITSTAVTVASGDNIVITDASDSSKIKRVANILTDHVKDGTAHTNIGSSASATQATINTNIDTALGNKVNTSDIADNLTTDSSTKVLSAKQGKALNDMIGSAITYIVGSGS